jgi:hypothetical protein
MGVQKSFQHAEFFFLKSHADFCLFVCFEAESHFIAQADLKLTILLFQPP